MLCTGSAIGIDGIAVFGELSANLASITKLVFLRMILQHTGESPEDIARARASLYEVHRHGPKIRMLPRQIMSLQTHEAGEGRARDARKKHTKN